MSKTSDHHTPTPEERAERAAKAAFPPGHVAVSDRVKLLDKVERLPDDPRASAKRRQSASRSARLLRKFEDWKERKERERRRRLTE